ncbi:MAG TPA: PQQ-binding-like beta-propeller repeat protein [Burkholderiales bacterium]|nr:PQQ-binding-like beta-propeller repeat protein [Burkholderiales bacterium]
MRISTAVIALVVFGLSSVDSIANDGQIYTATPPRPAVAPNSDIARAAASQSAASRSDYAPLLKLYSPGRTAADQAQQSPIAMNSTPGQAERAAAEPGWPMRGNDPANTGHTAALGPAVQTQPVWIFQPDASTFVWRPASGPDGTIYVATASFPPDGVDGRLYALRPDGSVKWQTELTGSSGVKLWTSATPVLDGDGNIYIAWAHDQDFGSLAAISLDSNGKIRWRFEPKIELEVASHEQPVLGDGVLYAAVDTSFFFGDLTHRASIFALDLATGNPAWHWNSPNLDTFFGGPVVGRDGYLYHASAANPLRNAPGFLYRIAPDGVLDWSVNIGPGVNEPPAIDVANNLYLGDLAGIVFKYDSAGILLWTYDTLSGQIFMSPVLNGARVMVGGANAGLHVLDAGTGELEAVFAPGKFPMSQASDRAGNVFFYSMDATGTVSGFGRGGRQWWTFNTGAGVSVNAVAIATDGKLLVGNSQTLQAYIAPVLGDLNCDGAVNVLDIEPYTFALTDPAVYARRFPRCYRSLADINGDGAVNALDIEPFVGLLR